MRIANFLSNETLWKSISDIIKNAHHVDAAIAYFGQEGSKLLPLKKGDHLVVDMSKATVEAGSTNPREIEKLLRRGVRVFTRRNLHAKLIVADKSMISGSANISKRSQKTLDEAAIITSDRVAIQRAREFIHRLSTEPIRPKYLKLCKRLYKPPRIIGEKTIGNPRQQRVKHAKLWIVCLVPASVPALEKKRYERGEIRAKKNIRDKDRSKIDSFHFSFEPKMAMELEKGDWIIQVIDYGKDGIEVFPPGMFLFIDNYVREKRKKRKRWVFHLEVPKRGETMTWKEFRRSYKKTFHVVAPLKPQRKPIREVKIADGLLGMWTPGGRVSLGL